MTVSRFGVLATNTVEVLCTKGCHHNKGILAATPSNIRSLGLSYDTGKVRVIS